MNKIKIGRNDPCHCGSGQKYKRCCLEKDQRAESAVLAQAAAERLAATAHHHHHHAITRDFCGDTFGDDDADELTTASNAIVDMVHDGKLDEAEQAARDFLVRFPEVHDGYDRLGMVYEARGDNKQAADYYRKVIDFVRAHPDQYEPGFEDTFHRLIQKLDPARPTDSDSAPPNRSSYARDCDPQTSFNEIKMPGSRHRFSCAGSVIAPRCQKRRLRGL